MFTRHVGCNIFIAGKNVTGYLDVFLKSVSYEDVLDGEADTCEIELHDVERLFISDWFPQRGDKIRLELWRNNWRGDGQIETLDLGNFELDEITNSYPPSVIKIKGNSIPSNSALRQVDESQSWENVKLSRIARDIAEKSGVILFYDATEDPEIRRAEQAELSRMAFLSKLCRDNGLALKFYDWRLVIFDEAKYEQRDAISILDYDLSTIKSFSARATLTEIYKSAEVNYKDGKADEMYSGRFDDPNKSSGKTLKINQRVSNKSEAERLARKKLRDKNKDELKIDITVVGRFDYLAGNVIELRNHGFYNGRYLIEKATHRVSTGYTCSLTLRRCLEGY